MNKRVIGGTLLGLSVGALAGVLMAPKSGRQLREDIRIRATDMRDKAKSKMEESKDWMSDKIKSFRREVEEAGEELEARTKARRGRPRLFSSPHEE